MYAYLYMYIYIYVYIYEVYVYIYIYLHTNVYKKYRHSVLMVHLCRSDTIQSS